MGATDLPSRQLFLRPDAVIPPKLRELPGVVAPALPEFGISDDDQGHTYAGWREHWIGAGRPRRARSGTGAYGRLATMVGWRERGTWRPMTAGVLEFDNGQLRLYDRTARAVFAAPAEQTVVAPVGRSRFLLTVAGRRYLLDNAGARPAG